MLKNLKSTAILNINAAPDQETAEFFMKAYRTLKFKESRYAKLAVHALNTTIREDAKFQEDLEEAREQRQVILAPPSTSAVVARFEVVPCDEQWEEWEIPMLRSALDEDDPDVEAENLNLQQQCSYCLQLQPLNSLRILAVGLSVVHITDIDEKATKKFPLFTLMTLRRYCESSSQWKRFSDQQKSVRQSAAEVICLECFDELHDNQWSRLTSKKLESGRECLKVLVLYRRLVPSRKEGQAAFEFFSAKKE